MAQSDYANDYIFSLAYQRIGEKMSFEKGYTPWNKGMILRENPICSLEGCNKTYYAKKFCKKHYDMIRYNGKIKKNTFRDPNEIIIKETHAEVILRNQNADTIAFTLIDLEDVDKIKNLRWCLSHGYVVNRNIRLPQFLLNTQKSIDHINKNPLDNRKCNLRIATQAQNMCNISKRSDNTSGYPGVYRCNVKNKPWEARIFFNQKQKIIGYFKTKEEATKARKEAEKERNKMVFGV